MVKALLNERLEPYLKINQSFDLAFIKVKRQNQTEINRSWF